MLNVFVGSERRELITDLESCLTHLSESEMSAVIESFLNQIYIFSRKMTERDLAYISSFIRKFEIPHEIVKAAAIEAVSRISLKPELYDESNAHAAEQAILEIKKELQLSDADFQEVGEQVLLVQDNYHWLFRLDAIRNLYQVNPDFLGDERMREKIVSVVCDKILINTQNIKVIIDEVKSHNIEENIFSFIDVKCSEEVLPTNLIRFIKDIGDLEFIKCFPLTHSRVLATIPLVLEQDQYIADYFVENLNKYYQQPWVPENVAKAIQHYSVAQKFINAVEDDRTAWKNEAWVTDVIQKIIISVMKAGEINYAKEVKKKFSIQFDEKNKEDIKVMAMFSTSDIDFFDSKESNLDNYTEQQLKEMWLQAKEFPMWQDEQIIVEPFQAGAEVFGYKRMLEYIKREGLSLHDAVHAFRDVLELFKASGLGESEFYGKVLQQVSMDDREYPEGTAHHHLNAIAQTANKNVVEVIARVQEYKEIERLQELATTFNTPQAVFASWINLKRYSELEQLLGQTEVFDELKKLKAEGKEKLYRYVETLAFHPDSKVNMSAILQFWRDPESFLAAEASHTPYEVHDRKKPSNYLNRPVA